MARHVIARGALALALAALAPTSAAAAQTAAPVPPGEIVQISTRLALGGGAGFPVGRDASGVFELALRADALFGDAAAHRARIGPAIDLRTATFGSLEVAGGLAGLVPLGWDFALTLTLGAGYALRERGLDPVSRDGAIAIATLSAAFRPYDHFDAYGYAVGIYVGGRAGFAGHETWEITGGVEIDLELVLVAPVRFLVTATGGGDPHEGAPHGDEPRGEESVSRDR